MSNQQPFDTRFALADTLHIPENKIRVIAPDVGGAFGAKCYLYPEDVLVCIASIDLERPVKWIETRSENMATMFHGRGQDQFIEAAVTNDGVILGLKVKIISDSGAYASPETFGDPEVTVNMLPAQYNFKNFFAELFCVYTNKVPFDAYRGAGRPEATYLIERVVDRVASELGLDPTEVRLKNFLQGTNSEFKSITGYTYEIGDYEANLKKALETVNYYRWRRIQRDERIQGKRTADRNRPRSLSGDQRVGSRLRTDCFAERHSNWKGQGCLWNFSARTGPRDTAGTNRRRRTRD